MENIRVVQCPACQEMSIDAEGAGICVLCGYDIEIGDQGDCCCEKQDEKVKRYIRELY